MLKADTPEDLLRQDAMRFRWLRDSKAYIGIHPHYRDLPKSQRTGWTIRLVSETSEGTLEAAIDAAMKAEGKRSA